MLRKSVRKKQRGTQMGNVYLVYLLQCQIHSVFSVFGGWRVEYTASVYFVYLFQGQIHSVFGVFASVHVCISHLGLQPSSCPRCVGP